jgi:voltage-gated sodium channel
VQSTPSSSAVAEKPAPDASPRSGLVAWCKALISRRSFDIVILAVIIINAVVLGMETFPALASEHRQIFTITNDVILGIYVVELLIRLTAFRWNPREFAKDRWNVFDFVVVVASLIPWLRATAMLLRLVRVARIVRVVRFLPDLRIIVGAIGRSIPGVASLAAATLLMIYIFAMVGWVLFGGHDPQHYGDLGRAMQTMFIMLTLENLPDNIEMGQQISGWTIIFFITYAVVMSFLIFNLFIGIVLNSMEEAREVERSAHEKGDLLARLRAAREALEEAEQELQKTHRDDR